MRFVRPSRLELRTRIKFALCPRVLKDGTVIWLEQYEPHGMWLVPEWLPGSWKEVALFAHPST